MTTESPNSDQKPSNIAVHDDLVQITKNLHIASMATNAEDTVSYARLPLGLKPGQIVNALGVVHLNRYWEG